MQFDGAKDISAEAMHAPRKTDGKPNLVNNQACFGCTIACGRVSKIDETHYTVVNKPQYWGASGGLEYEAAWALGAANGVNDLEALTYANFVCNEDGFDPISFGATVGAVMELYEMGVLSKEQIGIEAPFGSTKALTYLAELTARGEGFGKEVGLGSKRLCAKYGHPGAVDDGQGTGISGVRPARHPGHGPCVRDVESRRVPPARLYGRFGGARHSGEDRSVDD